MSVDPEEIKRKLHHVYGWVSSVGKSLPVPLDYEGQPTYEWEPGDFDWWVTVTVESGTDCDFQISVEEIDPIPLLGQWIEVTIMGIELTIKGKTDEYFVTGKNLIVRE